MTINLNKNLIPVAIFVAGALVAGAFVYTNQEGGGALSPQAAAEKAMAFINQSIQEENVTASLIDVAEESGLYKIHLKIEETGAEYNSYITKDGKFLFASGFNLEEQTEQASQQEPIVSEDFAKCLTDKGMKFYGSKNCGWCQKQKELLGESMKYINYIECVDKETGGVTAECQAEGILVPGGLGVPSWQLPDGKMESGYKTLEQLTELSGCPLQ